MGIESLAQTADGYLWIGSNTGLFRFDGIRYEAFSDLSAEPLLDQSIALIWAPPSGGLWIHYSHGGASFLKNGHLTHYKADGSLGTGTILALTQENDGTLWAAKQEGLARFDGRSWRLVNQEMHLPEELFFDVFVDRDGSVWASTQTSIYVLKRGARFFEHAVIASHFGSFAQTKDGTLWLEVRGTGLRRLTSDTVSNAPPATWFLRGVDSFRIVASSDGSLWTSWDAGVRRLSFPKSSSDEAAPQPLEERFDKTNGLSGNRTTAVLEDREGNVWIGTDSGLDRFRVVPLNRASTPLDGQYFAIAAAPRGAVWIGNSSTPSSEVHDWLAKPVQGPEQLVALNTGPSGITWAASSDALWRSTSDGWSSVPMPTDRSRDSGHEVQAVAEGADGALYLSIQREHVRKYLNGHWSNFGDEVGLPDATAGDISLDADGRLWFGFLHSRLAMYDGRSVRLFTSAEGLPFQTVFAVEGRRSHVWVAGDSGVARFDGRGFVPVKVASDRPFRNVSGIVETKSGDLWLNGSSGVARIAAGEIRKYLEDANYQVESETFGMLDGLPGAPSSLRPLPTAVEGNDGRIWFATINGVAWIDPAAIYRNKVIPPIWIESVTIDGQRQPATSEIRLKPGRHDLQIAYAGLSLSNPERAIFRYRLAGEDRGWQEAGTRRTAFYTNLAAGHYRFSVIGSNDAGVWNTVGDSLSLIVPPRFYETWVFRVLCAAGFLALLWCLHRVRLQRITRRLRARLEDRVAERERIARDLHDTLLQSFQGMVLKFHGLMTRLSIEEAARSEMMSELDQADLALLDAHGRVMGLQSFAATGPGLKEALEMRGADLMSRHGTKFAVQVEGIERPVDPGVAEEAHLIGREALANAFNHANAERIELEIDYGRQEFRMTVSDNGTGLPEIILKAGSRVGRLGLVSMRQRAMKIGGRLEMGARLGGGTNVVLRVPAAIAYQFASESIWDKLKRQWSF